MNDKSKKTDDFRDEYSEPCFPAGRLATAMMILASVLGTILWIVAICYSRKLYHFLLNP